MRENRRLREGEIGNVPEIRDITSREREVVYYGDFTFVVVVSTRPRSTMTERPRLRLVEKGSGVGH